MTGVEERAKRSAVELGEVLAHVRASPPDRGSVAIIVRRPAEGQREVLAEAELSLGEGVVGDNWNRRPSRRSPDGGPHPDMQLNVINSRFSRFLAHGDDHEAARAGDQLHLDLDLSVANLPPGSRLHIGPGAVIEVTDQPHTGCQKFTERFGLAAMRAVNSDEGKAMRLRGLNARVVVPGTVRPGDAVIVDRVP